MISIILLKAKNIVSVRLDEDSYNDLVEQANDDSVTITEKCREHIENGISGSFDEQEPTIQQKEQLMKQEQKPLVFDVDNANLFVDGKFYASCKDVDLRAGEVYDLHGNFLGKTTGLLKQENAELRNIIVEN